MSEPRCPYCLETVIQNAQKCRHCGSSLKPEAPAAESGDVTFVVDKGIIRFGKFAVAVLALVVALGSYIFAFDTKELVKEMRQVQADLDQRRTELAAATAELETARTQLGTAQTTLKTVQDMANNAVKEVRASTDLVKGLVAQVEGEAATAQAKIRDSVALTEEEAKKAQAARAKLIADTTPSTQPPQREAKLWPIGYEVKVHFFDGTENQHKKVEEIASEWAEYANISFDFEASAEESDVRISFDPNGGSWSYLGTDALGIADKDPTMNLAYLEKPFILHEFGHALGLQHEFQNPNADLSWNIDAISADMPYLSKSQIESSYARKISDKDYPGHRDFDRQSVMNNAIPSNWLKSGGPIEQPQGLSASDQDYIAELYPPA